MCIVTNDPGFFRPDLGFMTQSKKIKKIYLKF
jgi:hypothetical protein